MQAIEDFSEPAYVIVPGDLHRMDAKIWKDRYPNMIVVAPAGIRLGGQRPDLESR